ncbi:MAG TPA: GNAT family N-acetyltransferase [Solirubrobacterales bacterium]|jgi:ribosomal protein S18 acetylase RimI-like enzyme
MVRIRQAQEDDAAAVTALWTEAYAGRGPGGRSTPYTDSEFFESLRSGQVHVAEKGGGVVGVVVLYPPGVAGRTIGGDGEAELSRLAVSAVARRAGIGRRLVQICAAQARADGAEAIVLWSRPYQSDAHRLYESLGYRRLPERDSEDADGRRLVFRCRC